MEVAVATGLHTKGKRPLQSDSPAVEPAGVESCNMGLFTVNDGAKLPVKDFSMPRYLCASSKKKNACIEMAGVRTNFRVWRYYQDYSKRNKRVQIRIYG
jgi:hypothetical protein